MSGDLLRPAKGLCLHPGGRHSGDDRVGFVRRTLVDVKSRQVDADVGTFGLQFHGVFQGIDPEIGGLGVREVG